MAFDIWLKKKHTKKLLFSINIFSLIYVKKLVSLVYLIKKKLYFENLNLCVTARDTNVTYARWSVKFFYILHLISETPQTYIDHNIWDIVLFVDLSIYSECTRTCTSMSLNFLVSKYLNSLVLYSRFFLGWLYQSKPIADAGNVGFWQCWFSWMCCCSSTGFLFSAFSRNLEKTDIGQILLRVSHKWYKDIQCQSKSWTCLHILFSNILEKS